MENIPDLVIEHSTATWSMPMMDGELGGTYRGTFKFKCFLTPIEQLQVGRKYRALLGDLGSQASQTEGSLAFALTQLEVRVISAPPFWGSTSQESGISGNLGDINVIMAVLNAAISAEELYKNNIQKEREAVLERSIKIAEELQKKDEK